MMSLYFPVFPCISTPAAQRDRLRHPAPSAVGRPDHGDYADPGADV